jgi:hypothetical protein
MLTLAAALGTVLGPAEIRRVALVKLSPAAVQAATLLANLVLANVEGLALTIAGLADDAVLEALLAGLQVPPITPDKSPEKNKAAAATALFPEFRESGDAY